MFNFKKNGIIENFVNKITLMCYWCYTWKSRDNKVYRRFKTTQTHAIASDHRLYI